MLYDMLKIVLTSELKKRFPNMNIQFGGADNVIATIPPICESWEPIMIFGDDDEATIFLVNLLISILATMATTPM